jgi:hypothetical protein
MKFLNLMIFQEKSHRHSDRVTSPESTSASDRLRTSLLYGSDSQNSEAPTASSRLDDFSPLHSAYRNGEMRVTCTDIVQALLDSNPDVTLHTSACRM